MTQSNYYVPSYLIKVNNTELKHGTTVDVMSVSVTETINQADTFNFTVRDRPTDPTRIFAGGDEFTWMDSEVFNDFNKVEIYMGYVGKMELLLVGEILGVNSTFPASGQPSLTVRGQSYFHRLYRERRRKPFESATDSDMAKEIASKVGLDADIHSVSHQHEMIPTHGDTLGALLRRRAERLNYEVAVKENKLIFQRPGYRDQRSATLTLEWGRDLISFSPSISTHGIATQVRTRSSQTSRGRSKDALVGSAGVGDEQVSMGEQTGQQIVQQRCGENEILYEDHDIDSPEEANEIAQAQFEASGMKYMTGRGSCIGNPELRARKVVELKGLGKKFSGIYYVTSTTHAIGSSGYTTNFQVQRNAR